MGRKSKPGGNAEILPPEEIRRLWKRNAPSAIKRQILQADGEQNIKFELQTEKQSHGACRGLTAGCRR